MPAAIRWRGRQLGDLLRYGANVFTCDDHEYWNGYPDWMPHLSRSFGNWEAWARAGMRALWRRASVANFAPGVKGGTPPVGGAMRIEPRVEYRGWCQWRVAGLDVFVADTRSDRTTKTGGRCPERLTEQGACSRGGKPHAMSKVQADALSQWIDHVERLGVLVLGQPLVMAEHDQTSWDPDLTEFPEHAQLVKQLRGRLDHPDRPASFIVLTGDIHWGRLVSWESPRSRGRGHRLVEFVSSAIGRVTDKNILGSSFNVAGHASTELTDAEMWTLGNDLFVTKTFASGQNNAGLLRIRRPARDRYEADFELWNLETQDVADNKWVIGSCLATLSL